MNILEGVFDFTQLFHKPESANYVDLSAGFKRPPGFD
jgi:hypothetical protein